jgi:hypothetical protein
MSVRATLATATGTVAGAVGPRAAETGGRHVRSTNMPSSAAPTSAIAVRRPSDSRRDTVRYTSVARLSDGQKRSYWKY